MKAVQSGPKSRRLGDILVEEGKITPAQLQAGLASQAACDGDVPLLGHLLIEKGWVKREEVERALDFQEALGRTCAACGVHCPAILFDMEDVDRCPSCGSLFETRTAKVAAEVETLGKYRLLRRLGRGASAAVYEALDTTLNRPVALKLLRTSGGPMAEVESFTKEAQLCANLPKHPHIVSVYEAGVLEGRPYIAMELIEGAPLSSRPRRGARAIRQHARLLRDVALAVHHAHEHGIVHCDLKPRNVMVDEKGRPYVTDFGLARPVGARGGSLASGMTAGTPAYMSPEQARGVSRLDRRTDVYSLGVMLYEMLTGHPPFKARNADELLRKTVFEAVPAPSSAGGDRTADALCLRALAKRPEERHPTAKAFADDLTRWLKGETSKILKRKPAAPPRRWILAGAAILAATLGLVAFRGRPAPDLSRAEAALVRGDFAAAEAEYLRHSRHAAAIQGLDRVRAARQDAALIAKRREVELQLEEVEKSRRGRREPLEWLIAGPFDSRGERAAPEVAIDLDREMRGKGGPVRWRARTADLRSADEGQAAVFDFAELLRPNTDALVYALLHVKAPAAMSVVLLLGSDDGVKVWLNGLAEHEKDVARGVKLDEDSVPLRLKPGWNRLLFRVRQGNGGWGLAARIVSPRLRPLDVLEYDAYGDLPKR